VKEFKSKGWVNVAVSEKKGYVNGMAQPAILTLKKDGTVVESWAIVPSLVSTPPLIFSFFYIYFLSGDREGGEGEGEGIVVYG
jgi:hypothetical protein